MVMRFEAFTEQAQEILGKSQEIVRRYKHSQWDAEHVLMALLEHEDGVPAEILRQLGVPVPAMRARLDELLERSPKATEQSSQIYVAPRAANVLERAKQEAQRLNDDFIGTEHILVALVQEDQGDVANVLKEFNVALESVYQALQQVRAATGSPTRERRAVTSPSTGTASTLPRLRRRVSWTRSSAGTPRSRAPCRRSFGVRKTTLC